MCTISFLSGCFSLLLSIDPTNNAPYCNAVNCIQYSYLAHLWPRKVMIVSGILYQEH